MSVLLLALACAAPPEPDPHGSASATTPDLPGVPSGTLASDGPERPFTDVTATGDAEETASTDPDCPGPITLPDGSRFGGLSDAFDAAQPGD